MADYPGYFKKPKWPSSPLGSRVRRGPNWKYQNEDNNMAGTVIGGGVNDEGSYVHTFFITNNSIIVKFCSFLGLDSEVYL